MNSIRRAALLAPVLCVVAAAASADPPPGLSTWPNRGRLGAQVQSMTDELRDYFGAPEDRGVLVVRVEAGRPAAQAGVRVGDVIVGIGQDVVETPFDLIRGVARVPAGQKLGLDLVRRGERQHVEMVPDGEAVTLPDGVDWHSIHEHMQPGLRGGAPAPPGAIAPDATGEILRRLESIERRLEDLERHGGTQPPPEKHT
jgi:membrane-associated protease RseP (regulator of RpoE activity)